MPLPLDSDLIHSPAGSLIPLLYRQFRLPRQGHSLEECQDASAGSLEHSRFAIADGASEGAFASVWAHLLVDDFVRTTAPAGRVPGGEWADRLTVLQERWVTAVSPRPEEPPLPWYVEQGLQQGAFATFLGLVLHPEENGCWHWAALAVGDSCLFHMRKGILLQAFPISRSTDFDNTPWLVGSRTSPGEVPRQRAVFRQGQLQAGDCLWLMTDALAQWFLRQSESGGKPHEALEPLLRELTAEQTFARWIADLRRTRQLHNDDVTLLGIRMKEEG